MATKTKAKVKDKTGGKGKALPPPAPPARTYTARELRALPRAEQDAILEAQAAVAAKDYAQHPELMEFTTALGGDDFAEY